MSCQLSAISKFNDIFLVKRFFFPSSKEGTPVRNNTAVESHLSGDADSWGNDWGFDDQETTTEEEAEGSESSSDAESTRKWLQTCLVSLSPANDVLVIAHEHKICALEQKWDPNNKGEEIDSSLTRVWESCLGVDEKETITAVMCLPLASQKRSAQGGPDWTCIIVGFSSGFIRMYSHTGVLLLSQLLHAERVERLKCRTYCPPRFLGLAEIHDELLIMYTRAIVSIDGFSLIQSLRACRNQVARATASGSDNLLQPPPLAYKKWSLGEQEKVNDYVACGVVCAQPFDQLKAASMLGGVKAAVKISPPAMSVFMTTGSGPYVGFFYAVEGLTQPMLSEVAMAMAHKIKSALLSAASGWLGFGGKAKEEKDKPPKIEPATPLPLRFGLPDKRRDGDKIILSPCNNYAATTDSFGRVILIDVQRGMAIRMWKGYRDAQLGWVEVKEDTVDPTKTADHYRVAQFLIIYAPRRGILEVWLSAHGPRVAAFNVSKSCRLLCPTYGLMGLNNVTCRGMRSKVFQVALIDPDGVIKTIDIPFHLALSDKSSKRARDLHLLKKLKAFLKESSETQDELEETITQILMDLKVASIAHQAIERVLSTRYLPLKIMQSVVKACVKKLGSRAEDTLDLDSRMMLKFCKAQDTLLALYSSMLELNSSQVEPNKLSDLEILTNILCLSQHDAKNTINILATLEALTGTDCQITHVTFKEDLEPLPATSFLHAFSYRTLFTADCDAPSTTTSSPTSGKSLVLTISKEASEERRLLLAKFLFGSCLEGKCQASEVLQVVQRSSLPPDQLLNILLLYWLSKNNRTLKQMASLYDLVKLITAMTDSSEVVVDPNEVSAWWQRVRNMCAQSENVLAAYLAILACKSVAFHSIGCQNKGKDPDADTASLTSDDNEPSSPADTSLESHDWETLTVDMEQWELITKQSEDVVGISTLLNISSMEGTGSKAIQPLTVSIARLLNSGKGSVPELVARYVVQQELYPASLFTNYSFKDMDDDVGDGNDSSSLKGEEDKKEEIQDKSQNSVRGAADMETEQSIREKTQEMTQSDKVKYQMNELRKRFPHSLDNDILLSNCCWEYAVAWNKDPQNTLNLELSLEYLRLVHNAVLRQGVSSLLWHMFVQKKASAAAHLMEKVGKSPKDRLCRKEVGVSDTGLVIFISHCVEFMEILQDANCEAHEVPVCHIEVQWQKSQGPASLVELAVDQKATNYGLLRVHYHLLKMMSAVLALGMKSVKVLSLFDNKGRGALFRELHSHPVLPTQKVDNTLISARKTFLCRIITSAVGIIDPPVIQEADSTPGSHPVYKRQRSHHPAAFKWAQVALELAKDFGLDMDLLKRHHVCELYSFGHDKLAEEVLGTVNDQEEMGVQLLNLAGQRISYEIFRRNLDDNFQHLASMSTTLTRWLQTLNPDGLQFPVVPLSWTVTLLENATSKLQEPSTHHELAQELLEKTKMMI